MSRIIENPKQLILEKAKEILYNQGYSKLNMRALSKACGIALGTTYNYYPTKKDLVTEMMMEYWQSYLNSVNRIATSDHDVYQKLGEIFEELKAFIESFRQYWLTPELYDSPEYAEGGLREEHLYMEKLIQIVKEMLDKEQMRNTVHSKLGSLEMAKFIIMNFVSMVQMPFFQYATFELFLKELLH